MFLVLRILFVRYVESSISEDEQSTWRRSSAPLLNSSSWETIPRFGYNDIEILKLNVMINISALKKLCQLQVPIRNQTDPG